MALFETAGLHAALAETSNPAGSHDCYIVLVRTSRGVGEVRECAATNVANTPLVALTDYRDADLTADVLGAGATSVLPIDTDEDLVIASIRLALAGISALETPTLDWVMQNGFASTGISDAERQWLTHLDDGLTIGQLAPIAGYSERSLYRQLNQLYHRLGATDRTSAISEARRRNLL